MTSDEGLNAYGAATWGQFFIYQGFNEHCGWMHTSSAVDAIDEYLETVVKKGERFFYKYGNEERPVTMSSDHGSLQDRQRNGREERSPSIARNTGPSSARKRDKWVSIALMQEPVKALTQSYTRTKARNYKEFQQTMELHTNSSNNTIFADGDGRHRLLSRQLHSAPRSEIRLDKAGRWQQSRNGLAWIVIGRRVAATAKSGERLALQQQQLALVGRGSKQSEAVRLSQRTSITASNPPAACTRFAFCKIRKISPLEWLMRRGIRQLPHLV